MDTCGLSHFPRSRPAVAKERSQRMCAAEILAWSPRRPRVRYLSQCSIALEFHYWCGRICELSRWVMADKCLRGTGTGSIVGRPQLATRASLSRPGGGDLGASGEDHARDDHPAEMCIPAGHYHPAECVLACGINVFDLFDDVQRIWRRPRRILAAVRRKRSVHLYRRKKPCQCHST